MATAYQSILFEVNEGIARLTLNRPERLNSFTTAMHGEVRDALTRLGPEGARTLVLTVCVPTTRAASRKSSMRALVQEPMNTRSIAMSEMRSPPARPM